MRGPSEPRCPAPSGHRSVRAPCRRRRGGLSDQQGFRPVIGRVKVLTRRTGLARGTDRRDERGSAVSVDGKTPRCPGGDLLTLGVAIRVGTRR